MPNNPFLPPIPASLTKRTDTQTLLGMEFARQEQYAVPEEQDERGYSAMSKVIDRALADPTYRQYVNTSVVKSLPAQPSAFVRGLNRALSAVSLPFDAFAEGLAGVVQTGAAAVLPGVNPTEHSRRAIATLGKLFTGEISPAAAAGELRGRFQERSTAKQLLLGWFLDPTNVLFPASSLLRTTAKAGLKAGLAAGARQAALSTLLPPGGEWAMHKLLDPKVVDHVVNVLPSLSDEAGAGYERVLRTIPAISGASGEDARQLLDRYVSTNPTAKSLMSAAKTPKERAIVALIASGIRHDELARMRVDDLIGTAESGMVAKLPSAKPRPGTDLPSRLGFHPISNTAANAVTEYIQSERKLGKRDPLFGLTAGGIDALGRALGKSVGMKPTKGSFFRSAALSEAAGNFILAGVPVDMAAKIAGHQDFDITAKAYLSANLPDLTVSLRESESKLSNLTIAPSKKALVDAATKEVERFRGVGAVGVTTGEVRKGKRASLGKAAEENLAASIGEAKIASIPLTPAQQALLATAPPSLVETMRGLYQVGNLAGDYQRAEDLMLLMRAYAENSAKAGKIEQARNWRQLYKKLEMELNGLSAGAMRVRQRISGDEVGRIFELDPNLQHAAANATALMSARASLQAEFRRGLGAGYRAAQQRTFKRANLTAAGMHEAELRGHPKLLGFGQVTSAAERYDRVVSWLQGGGGVGGVQEVLGFKLVDGVLVSSSLKTAKATLRNLAGKHPHLFGSDFSLANKVAVNERVNEVLVTMTNPPPGAQPLLRFTSDVSEGVVKERPLKGELKGVAQPPRTPPPTGVLTSGSDAGKNTAAYLFEDTPSTPHFMKLVKPSPAAKRVTAKLQEVEEYGKNKPTAVSWAVNGFGRGVHELFNFVALRGADADGFMQLLIGHNGRSKQVIERVMQAKPVYKQLAKPLQALREKVIIPASVASGGKQVKVTLWRLPIKDAERIEMDEAFLSYGFTKEQYLQAYPSVFEDVPDALLREVYDFDQLNRRFPPVQMPTLELVGGQVKQVGVEMRGFGDAVHDAILYLRGGVRRGTELANSHADIGELINKQIQAAYFPRWAAKYRPTSLLHRKLFETSTWLFDRQIADAGKQLQHGVEYFDDPVEVMTHYVAEVQLYAADVELRALMKNHEWVDDAGVAHKGFRELMDSRIGPEYRRLGDLITAAKKVAAGEAAGLSPEIIQRIRKLYPAYTDALTDPARAKELLPTLQEMAVAKQSQKIAAEQLHTYAGMKDIKFDDKQIKQLKTIFPTGENTFNKVLRAGNVVGTALRLMQAGSDFSVFAIHGALSLASAPFEVGEGLVKGQIRQPRFMRGMRAYFKAFFANDNLVAQMQLQNASRKAEFGRYAGMSGTPDVQLAVGEQAQSIVDFMPVMGRAEWLTKYVPSPVKGVLSAEGLRRFENAFTAFLDEMRLDMFEGMRVMYKAKLGAAAEDTAFLGEIAAHVMKSTGGYNQYLAGMPMSQQMLESTLLSFAANYRRAMMGLLVDVFRGNLRGHEAQVAVGKFVAAGAAWAGLVQALGLNNEKVWNPDSPRFMSARIPGTDTYIGIGTAYYSVARMSNAIYENAKSDPTSFYAFDFQDNALMKWWRSQAAPITNLGIDIALARTYSGDPLRTANDGGWDGNALLSYTAGIAVPFAVQDAMVGTAGDYGSVSLGSMLGARTFPVSDFQIRSDLRNAYLRADPELATWRAKNPGKTYDDLSVKDKRELDARHDDIVVISDRIQDKSIRFGRGVELDIAEFIRETEDNRTARRAEFVQYESAFRGGKLGGKGFTDAVRKASIAHQAVSENIQSRHPDAIASIEDARKLRNRDKDFVGDVAFDDYLVNVLLHPENEVDGIFQPESMEAKLTAWIHGGERPGWGLDMYEYVQARLRSSLYLPPEVIALKESQDLLKPYWNIYREKFNAQQADLLAQYFQQPDTIKPIILQQRPVLKSLLRRLEKLRQAYRRANPEVDWALVKYKDYAPITKLARDNAIRWRIEQAANLQDAAAFGVTPQTITRRFS